MTNEAERRAIRDLWPAHIEHLPPETNRLGQPYTDTEHGIVCNCGDVLGWPKDAPTPVGVVEHRYDSSPGQPSEDDDLTEEEAAALVMSGAYGDPPYDVQEQAMATLRRRPLDEDPADEAQAMPVPRRTQKTRRPIEDVELPPEDVELPPVANDPLVGTAVELASSEDTWPPRDSGGSEDPPDFAAKLPTRPTDVMIPADPLDARVTVIDPSLPYGPEQVEHQLIRIEGQLERGIHFQRYWEERLHYAKVTFELANARALIKADGGDAATRKAQALLACEAEYVELQVCETMVRSARECMHNLRSLQTGYQTISNSVGATYRSRPQGA